MFLKIIRKNINSQLIALTTFSIFFFVLSFIVKSVETSKSISFSFINISFENLYKIPIAAIFSASLLIIIQSLIFNSYLTNNNIVAKRTYMPALISAVLYFSFMGNQNLNPALCCSFLIIILIKYLLILYEKKEPYQEVLNIGFLIAILTLFNSSFVWLLVYVWLIFLFFNIKSWREYLIVIIGFTIPYIAIFIISYLNGNLNYLFNELQFQLKNVIISPSFHALPALQMIVLIIFSFLCIITIVYSNRKSDNSPIVVRKKMIVFFVLLLFLLFIWIVSNHTHNYLMIIFIPMSVYISNYFQNVKHKWVGELSFVLFMAVIVLFKILGL